jgi:xanthine dehydrogenase/oxidase
VWSPDSEPIFPPFLKTHPVPASLHIVGKNVTWYRPTSLRELLALKAANPAAKLIGGNSEIGIEVKFKDCKYPVLIALTHVQELRRVDVVRPSGAVTSEALLTLLGATSSGADVLGSAAVALSRDDVVRSSVASGGLVIGGGVTLSQLRDMFGRVSSDSTLPKHCARPCIAGYDMLRWFASTQIRNVATLAGNVATASPISDMNPLLVAMNAYVVVATPSTGSTRFVSMMRMFKGYRKTELQPEDIIVSIFLPFTTRFEYVFAYKQARRREDDITLVGGAFRVKLSSVGALHWKVDDACVAFAGMAPITAQSPATVTALTGAVWNESIVTSVAEALRKDLALPTTVPGGEAARVLLFETNAVVGLVLNPRLM